jgi:hypothetical protein
MRVIQGVAVANELVREIRALERAGTTLPRIPGWPDRRAARRRGAGGGEGAQDRVSRKWLRWC